MRKRLIILTISIISLPVLYFISVLIGGFFSSNSNWIEPANGETAYLLNNGYHITLALPVNQYKDDYFSSHLEFQTEGFYYFGWGDAEFYVGTPRVDDLDLSMALKALFLPTDSVLEVSYLQKISERTPGVEKIALTKGEISDIYDFINESMVWKNDEPLLLTGIDVDKAFSGSIFIKSNLKYNLFFTCNNWTGRALKKAGIKSGLWTPFAWKVGP